MFECATKCWCIVSNIKVIKAEHCSSTGRVQAEYRHPTKHVLSDCVDKTRLFFGQTWSQTVWNQYTCSLHCRNKFLHIFFVILLCFLCPTEDNNAQETLRREVTCLFAWERRWGTHSSCVFWALKNLIENLNLSLDQKQQVNPNGRVPFGVCLAWVLADKRNCYKSSSAERIWNVFSVNVQCPKIDCQRPNLRQKHNPIMYVHAYFFGVGGAWG